MLLLSEQVILECISPTGSTYSELLQRTGYAPHKLTLVLDYLLQERFLECLQAKYFLMKDNFPVWRQRPEWMLEELRNFSYLKCYFLYLCQDERLKIMQKIQELDSLLENIRANVFVQNARPACEKSVLFLAGAKCQDLFKQMMDASA